MNITLPPHLEELVKAKVASGHYHSASEVLREGLQLLEERDRLREMQAEELRREIQKGIGSGEPAPLNIAQIKARGRAWLAAQHSEG